MKILLCTPYIGLSPSNPGGIAIWARNIESYYKSICSNVELEIFPMDRKHESGDLSFFPRVWYGIREYIPIVRAFVQHIRNNEYDVIHICSSAQIGLIRDILLLHISKRRNIPSAIHFHFGRIPELLKSKGWEYQLLTSVVNKSSSVIVMSQSSYNSLLNAGFSNVVNLPNPLSDTVVSYIESVKVCSERDNNTILFVGHVIQTKGVYELVKACSKIDNIKLKIIGEYLEDTKYKLQNLADSICGNHEWIEFTGPIHHERVIQEMKKCALFVFPSYTEGFPNVILESMACGCPIIATPVGAIPEMLQFNSSTPCGCCIPVKSISELRNKIDYYIINQKDAIQMGDLAKKRVYSVYSISSVWTKLVSIWQDTYNR